jgi:anaerobic selenocysteine-containing dehydrogenase
MYVAGSLLPAHLQAHTDALSQLDFLVVQELFETDTTEFADVVLPAASFAEVDGTLTNSGGLVQRVRKSIEPVHQSLADWMITVRLANELGVDFGFERSSSAVFREIAERVPAYAGLRYPLLKDESNPVQVKHEIARQRDLSNEMNAIRGSVEALPDEGEKSHVTPSVGHELFKPGTLMSKTPQIHLLAAGNPVPESFAISPLYQITIDENLKREPVVV